MGIVRRILFFLCVFVIGSTFLPCEVSSASRKTIRVAYFDLGDYYKVDSDGSVNSYDAEYLSMISQYTDLDFTFVDCGTWENALKKLNDNEVDLVGTMQWTAERKKKYAICDASYGYTAAELVARGDSSYVYEGYEGMNGATVGYIEDYVIGDKVKAYMDEHNISFQIKTYTSQGDLDKALESDDIDLAVVYAHAMQENCKVIEKFDYTPFYFASHKENKKMIDEISQAIIKINVHQSDFEYNLIKKHFPAMIKSPYNKKELECIGEHKTYTVYFDRETNPVAWYDEESKMMKGALVDVCNQLESITGLKFKYAPRRDDVDKKTATDVMSRTIYYEKTMNASADKDEGVTNSILDQEFELYHREGDKYKVHGAYTIAVVKYRDGIKSYLMEKYPNCKVIEYDSPKQCLKKLEKKKVDLAFVNSHIAESVMTIESLDTITAIPVSEAILGTALVFQGEDAKVLSEIVNRGLKFVDVDAVNEAMLQYAMDAVPKMTMSYLMKHHFSLVMFLTLFGFTACITCVILIIYAQVMKRERTRMEEMNRERTDFFARMSHDMRTPMNGILGMLELTEQSHSMEEMKENTKKAKSSGQYMLSLINDTLDLQRLESKKLKMEPKLVSVKEFIDSIEEMMRPSAQQKHIHFQVHNVNVQTEYYVKIDPVRVKQIFVNILSNAIKFTPENGLIETTIEILSIDEHMASVKITIADSGIGMSKEFAQNHLFKPYSQEFNKVTNRYAGSGLGLAIVKNLVELMGGSIEVESEIGAGTTFYIQMDFEYAKDEVAREDLQSCNKKIDSCKEKLKGKRILICEDYPLNAEIAQRLLEAVGCSVMAAGDGQAGVDKVKESPVNSIDAILMDIRMPVMDGLKATLAIRALERTDAKSIPIIAMTANAYDSDKENSVRVGMNSHLAKPIEKNELYRTLSEYIKED